MKEKIRDNVIMILFFLGNFNSQRFGFGQYFNYSAVLNTSNIFESNVNSASQSMSLPLSNARHTTWNVDKRSNTFLNYFSTNRFCVLASYLPSY